MTPQIPEFKQGDLLLMVDVQVDFCPGGALPIEKGDEVVGILNGWVKAAQAAGIPIYASRDWHPRSHLSFKEQGGPWPPHCVQDTPGADFHPQLMLPPDAEILTKGTRFDQDQNSVFDQTGLTPWLKRLKVRRVFVGGLAQDVCVLASVLDAREAGFEVVLVTEATRPVTPEGGRDALEKMRCVGALIL